VHAHVHLDGACGTLQNPLKHYPHRTLAAIRRVMLGRYTTWEAMEKHKQGVRFRSYHLAFRPAGAFAYRYLWRQGYRDGWQGLLMACVWMLYVFITYTKLRQLQRH
jgi:hypothetical protein